MWQPRSHKIHTCIQCHDDALTVADPEKPSIGFINRIHDSIVHAMIVLYFHIASQKFTVMYSSLSLALPTFIRANLLYHFGGAIYLLQFRQRVCVHFSMKNKKKCVKPNPL